jgi:threonine 3-dehydrogenase
MKALVKKEAAPGLWLEEVPEPVAGDHDVIVKVRKAAICGTDSHIYKWDAWAQKVFPVGVIAGHECMGEIVEVGAHVDRFKVGQRVSVEGHLYCRQCRPCRDGNPHLCVELRAIGRNINGCFAEYISVPAQNIFPLPDSISDDIGALCDPLGNAVYTALSTDFVGDDVLITGAGPIGCMAAAVCRMGGARQVVVIDRNEGRLKLAKKMGATRTVNFEKEKLDAPNTFAACLEMSGSPAALNTIIEACVPGGQVALLGILPDGAGIDWHGMIFKGLNFQGIYGRKIFGTWYKMTHLLEAGLDIAPIITHRFPLGDYEKGFKAMISGESGKVILDIAE